MTNITDLSTIKDAVEKLAFARDTIRKAKVIEDAAKAAILAALPEGVGTVDGIAVVAVKEQHALRLDQAAFKNQLPHIHAAYLIDTTYKKVEIL